jgi:hypothetical protein
MTTTSVSLKDYQCPECGATHMARPDECCDACVLKFYFGNPFASTLDQYANGV